jgi:UDP-glucose 4-epimerase
VRVIDDLSTGHRENVEEIGGRVEFVRASLLDADALAGALKGVELVFHEAAIPSVPRSVENPAETHRACVEATFALLSAARAAGVRRLVYAASSSAYGDQPTLPKVEDMPPQPLSPYAAAKLVGEYYCQVWTRTYNFETVCLRYFNIFGPRQNANSAYAAVIAAFAKAVLAGRRPVIYGDGEQSRDFTYVHNVVHANLLAARRDEPVGGEVINVGCGIRISVNELAAKVAAILERPDLTPVHQPERAGDIKHSFADLRRARSLLGYEPVAEFEAGLAQTLAWYRSVL